jgi:Polyketide cyclase / dehydrase and lipid transport
VSLAIPAAFSGMKQFLLLACVGLVFPAPAKAGRAAGAEASGTGAEWKQESKDIGVAIHSRLHPGSAVKDYKGIGIIDAASAVVFAVLSDNEAYADFMPYTVECRVLKREKDIVLVYQRLDLPLISDRDYTLCLRHETWSGPEGIIYRIRWEPANQLGPPAKPGVVRVAVCEGGWLLEPQADGRTLATYSTFTDSGGALPSLVANNASRVAIRRLFEGDSQAGEGSEVFRGRKTHPISALS